MFAILNRILPLLLIASFVADIPAERTRLSDHKSDRVHIQTPPAWPPDPEMIFVEGVTFLDLPEASVNLVESDDARRILRIYNANTDTWHEYPYPPGVESIWGTSLRADGLIVVRLSFDYLSPDPRPADMLLLDPANGEYMPYPTVCEGRVLKAEPGEGHWTIASEDEQHDAVLCHSETGEQRAVLPASLTTERQVFSSPDGVWLVVTGSDWETNGDFQVFAYHLESDRMQPLGSVSRGLDNAVSVCGWVSETQGLICSGDRYRSWPGKAYYAFNVTLPNSLEQAFWGWETSVLRVENPPRYLSMISQDFSVSFTGGSGPEHLPCTLTLYDVSGVHHHEMGYECIPVIISQSAYAPYYRQGDSIFFLTKNSEEATVSSLHEYNVSRASGGYPIFTGEIESILSVSPDSRYIVLLLDENGILDFTWDIRYCCSERGGWRVAVLDWQTQNIVYELIETFEI